MTFPHPVPADDEPMHPVFERMLADMGDKMKAEQDRRWAIVAAQLEAMQRRAAEARDRRDRETNAQTSLF